MYTALFLIQSVLHLILFVWLLRVWRTTRAKAALVLFLPEIGLVYDNLIVALGSYVGLGPLLTALSWPRFWTHWLVGAWLIIVCGSVLRLAGFQWAQRRSAMGAFCGVTAGLMALDLRFFWTKSLHPVCELGLVRYSVSVAASRFCFPDQVVVPSTFPTTALITCLTVIATGALLWARRRFPWVFVGGALMLLSSSPLLMRLKLDNSGEVLISGGLIWAIAHFGGSRERGAAASGETAVNWSR